MLNGDIFFKKLMLMSLGVGLMTLLVTTAKADEQATRVHTFDLEGIVEVELSNGVGSVEIVPARDNELRVVVDIESSRAGLFRRRADVDDMDIEIKQRGDTLFLSFEEKNVNADWFVELPVLERLVVQQGVGELRAEIGATDLDVQMGVGDITVEAPEASTGRVSLNVGVGDASVRGGEILDSGRAFISHSIRAQGNGSQPLEIDLGVGDVDVSLK